MWARNVGKSIGSVVVISRSDNGRSSKKAFVILGCEKSGRYKRDKTEEVTHSGSKKLKCPFRLKGRLVKAVGGWILRVMCGTHNHKLLKNFEGHPYVGRLTSDEKSNLSDMTRNMVKPKLALLTLQRNNPDSHTTIRQIYNARTRIRSSLRMDRTELQYLMNLMHRDRYIHWHRKYDNTDVVRDICWAHPESITLLNTFNIVLLIDSTYKTNRYRMPLVEIVSVTSTDLTFAIAFAFVESEKIDNYTWVLEKLKSMIVRQDALPRVIVTDRELALMNAVAKVFPTSTNLLCHFHIKKNVRAKCKIYVHPLEKIDLAMKAFFSVVDSPDSDVYQQRMTHFEDVSTPFSNFIDYVKNTWLIPHKERFVSAWVDQVMHLGNTTTNRYVLY